MRTILPFHPLAWACAGLFAAGAALAQDAKPTPPPTDATTAPQQAGDFKRLDSNADGYINKDEAMVDAQVTSDFARRDINGDGKLSESEFATAAAPPPTDDAGKKP